MQAKILLDQLKVHILQNRETSVEPSLTSLLKILWLGFWIGFATLILFLPITGAALLSTTGNLAFRLSRVWAWIMLRVSNLSVAIKNKGNIQKGQSYVIISNHQSLYDIPAVLTTLDIQFRWIIKKELLKIPLFGQALYTSRNIFIE